MKTGITVAIDGYSACGKSTLAKDLAKKLNYTYIDTGAMYRAFTLYCLRNDIIRAGKVDYEKLGREIDKIAITFKFDPDNNDSQTILNGENVEIEIRQMHVAENVSQISVIKEVRKRMVELQRNLAKGKSVVMDGRDIGTVVLPNAELKLFVTADVNVRAERRYRELIEKGENVSFEEIKENLIKRDNEDTSRIESPLKKAHDAIALDNTAISTHEQLEYALELVILRTG